MKGSLKIFFLFVSNLIATSANAIPIGTGSVLSDPVNIGAQHFRVVTASVPDVELGRKFARSLVQQGLAATVNIFPNTETMYVWNGELQEHPECILFIYTHQSQYENIEKFVKDNQIHVEPGVVSLPIVGGSSGFLQWLMDQSSNKAAEQAHVVQHHIADQLQAPQPHVPEPKGPELQAPEPQLPEPPKPMVIITMRDATQQTDLQPQQTSLEPQQTNLEHQQTNLEHQQTNLEHQQTNLEHQQTNLEHQETNLEPEHPLHKVEVPPSTTEQEPAETESPGEASGTHGNFADISLQIKTGAAHTK